MITVKFSKRQIEWALWLLEKRYGTKSPTALVLDAIAEVVRNESNVQSLIVSAETPPTPTKKRATAKSLAAPR